jgi:hypothetical protein
MHGHDTQARVKNGPALAGHGAEAVRDAIAASILTLPEQLRRSLTWDQGAEMAEHAQLRIDAGIDIYFCDPQSPWQRDTNENTNGLLRQYFPRGTDLCRHGPDELAAVARRSTPGHARRSPGAPPPKPSTTTCLPAPRPDRQRPSPKRALRARRGRPASATKGRADRPQTPSIPDT